MQSIKSKPVCIDTVTDPDTKLPVTVEIRKMETGPMVGFDGSYLEQLEGTDHPWSPYDEDTKVIVPDDEDGPIREGDQEAHAFLTQDEEVS